MLLITAEVLPDGREGTRRECECSRRRYSGQKDQVTPNLSPSVAPDLARQANAIVFEWVDSIGGLPEPDVVWDAPADPGQMVAVKLRFPHEVTLPPGIPMLTSLGEEGSQGSVVVMTTEPKCGTTALVVVDLIAQRLHAVVYIGPPHSSP
ncbi:MAG TPA: hypothetical protein VE441_08455 [Mycobacterium sp.]|nr:hypothetical protein [Mycobacterium sp.]